MPSTPNGAAAKPPTQDEADRRLAEGLDNLDTARAEGLRRGALIQRTQAAGATRERDRLAAKYGADHPRVRAAGARVATETRLATAVAAQADQARAAPPQVDAGMWAVQGRVLHADGTPAAGLTVSLWFEGGGWDKTAGHVCTDHNGAFILRYPPGAGGIRLQLVVSQGAAVLHRDPRLLTPAAGTIDTRVIVLGDKAGFCPPPDFTDGQGGDAGLVGGGGGGAKNVWSVRGRVTDAEGKPAAGVTVSLFDADLIFDDRLGQTTTNADGEYLFTYRTRDFRDLIEHRPDLYLRVLDPQGGSLHRGRTKIKAEAGHEEVVDIKLSRRPGAK